MWNCGFYWRTSGCSYPSGRPFQAGGTRGYDSAGIAVKNGKGRRKLSGQRDVSRVLAETIMDLLGYFGEPAVSVIHDGLPTESLL